MTELLSPEQFAQIMRSEKPHLIELENMFKQIEFGTVEVQFEVRGGVVNKMSFFNKKTWLRDKVNP
jgi:hypothetical protein